MNGIMELNRLSVYSFTFCLKAFLYCKYWPKKSQKGDSLSNSTPQPHPVKRGVRTRISRILWIRLQIWCCQGCSWGFPWCCWIQGWWRFWEVFALCPFSRFVGWFCIIILYFGCFASALQVWFQHRRLSSSLQAFPPIFFSYLGPYLYYLQLFALLGIIVLYFCLLLSFFNVRDSCCMEQINCCNGGLQSSSPAA